MHDINSPTQALELAARIVRDISTALRSEGWIGDDENPDIPETVIWQTWRREATISRTVIRYLGATDDWEEDVKKAACEVLPRHGQIIERSSFFEIERGFMTRLESEHVKVVIENVG